LSLVDLLLLRGSRFSAVRGAVGSHLPVNVRLPAFQLRRLSRRRLAVADSPGDPVLLLSLALADVWPPLLIKVLSVDRCTGQKSVLRRTGTVAVKVPSSCGT